MNNQFWYDRTVYGKRKNEVTGEMEEYTEQKEDTFDITRIIRGSWRDMDTFLVLLSDGHEESKDEQKAKFNKDGKPMPGQFEIKRERSWYASHIELNAKDVARLKAVTRVHEYRLTSEELLAKDSSETGILKYES